MSVSLTEQAVVERRKTVTRRKGWTFLKPGDRLTLCRKVMGRKAGEPLVRLAEVEVVSVRRERLVDMDEADVQREAVHVGALDRRFDDWWMDGGPAGAVDGAPTAAAWVDWFAATMGCHVLDEVTRIEWRYLA